MSQFCYWNLNQARFLPTCRSPSFGLVSESHIENCIGSSQNSICHQGFSTEGLRSSCLFILFLGNVVQALIVCALILYALPLKERYGNLELGIWLILSAFYNIEHRDLDNNSTYPLALAAYPRCRVCVFTLELLTTPHLAIRCGLQACSVVRHTKSTADRSRPFENIFSVLPTKIKLPYYATQSATNLDLLHAIKDKI